MFDFSANEWHFLKFLQIQPVLLVKKYADLICWSNISMHVAIVWISALIFKRHNFRAKASHCRSSFISDRILFWLLYLEERVAQYDVIYSKCYVYFRWVDVYLAHFDGFFIIQSATREYEIRIIDFQAISSINLNILIHNFRLILIFNFEYFLIYILFYFNLYWLYFIIVSFMISSKIKYFIYIIFF